MKRTCETFLGYFLLEVGWWEGIATGHTSLPKTDLDEFRVLPNAPHDPDG